MDCGSSGSGMPSPKLLPPQGRKAPRNRHPTSLPSRGPAASPAAEAVDNYFNYFTEIEEHFQKRRGGILLLSTLDWALIETWKDAGIPLEAVLRGIDGAFERYEKRPSKRKVNSLAYCAQEVLNAAEEMKEAAVGGAAAAEVGEKPSGFQNAEIAAFLRRNAEQIEAAKVPHGQGISAKALAAETACTLMELALGLEAKS